MDWQKIDFTSHQIALGALDKILKEFMDTVSKPNISMDGVGVFASKKHDKKVSLFFTPNAVIYLSSVTALYALSPCNKPIESEIDSFVFGDDNSWDLIS